MSCLMSRARDALFTINADDRDIWLRLGMAIKSEFGEEGFALWDEWSSQSESYNARDCRSVWKSIDPTGGVTIATLFFEAQRSGWTEGAKHEKPTAAKIAERDQARAEHAAAAAEQVAASAAAAAQRAAAILATTEPAPDDHPYLARKGVSSHGLRVGAWEWVDKTTGEVHSSPGHLIVPLRDRQKQVHSLQFIDPSGKNKRYLANGAKQGHFFAIGTARKHAGQPVFVLAEGYATAASVHEATEHLVLTCFDAGNLLPVAQAIRARQPDAILIIAADNDIWTQGNPGMTAARKVAEAVGALVCAPPFTAADHSGVDDKGAPIGPSDFNDWHALHGLESVADIVKKVLMTGAVQCVPMQAPAPAQSDDELELGIIVLGVQGTLFCFWRDDTRSVEVFQAWTLSKHTVLQTLAPTQRWENWSGGDFNVKQASDYLINKAKLLGQVDLARVSASLCPPDEVRRQYVLAVAHAHSNPAPSLIAEIISMHPQWAGLIRLDRLAGRPVCTKVPPCGGDSGPWTDAGDARLAGWLQATHGLNLSALKVNAAVNFLAEQNAYHPVIDYLGTRSWDGVDRLDSWLIDLAGAPDNAYVRAVSAKTLIGAVARVHQPGCKFDTALCLEGAQGVGKSSLFRALIEDPAWFAEDLGAPIGQKDALVGLSGKWIIELAEIAAMKKSTAEDVKSFLSRCIDSYRSPYGRRQGDYPRQCIFVGTLNPDADGAWLSDTTGGRRFWPVKVGRCDARAVAAVRDQLWAEAAHRYRAGEPYFLSPELEAMAAAEQLERLEDNPWSHTMDGYIKAHPHERQISLSAAFEWAQHHSAQSARELRPLAQALRDRGWTEHRIGTKPRLRIWRAPEEPPI